MVTNDPDQYLRGIGCERQDNSMEWRFVELVSHVDTFH